MGDSPVSRPKLARRQTVTALHDNLAAVVGGQSTEVTRRLLLRNLTERLRGEAADLPEESTAQRRKFLRTLVAQAACEIDKAGSALDHADRGGYRVCVSGVVLTLPCCCCCPSLC